MRRSLRLATARSSSAPTPDVDAIEKRIQILLESTRRERDRCTERMNGTQTRATVLIGAAGVLGGIQSGAAGLGGAWAITSIVLYVLAGVAGIVLLWPLKVLVVSNQIYFAEMMDYHPVDLQESLLRNELNASHHTQKRLAFRSWTLIVGFALLAAAWGASLAGLSDAGAQTQVPVQVEIVDRVEP